MFRRSLQRSAAGDPGPNYTSPNQYDFPITPSEEVTHISSQAPLAWEGALALRYFCHFEVCIGRSQTAGSARRARIAA